MSRRRGLVYVLLRDRPETVGLPPVDEWQDKGTNKSEDLRKSIRSTLTLQLSLLKLPALWIIGLAAASMYMTEAPSTAGHLLHRNGPWRFNSHAGILVGSNTITGIAGAIAYGYLSDRFFGARRPPLTLLFGLLEIAALFLIFFAPGNSLIWVSVGFLLYGFALNGILAVLGGLFALDIAPRGQLARPWALLVFSATSVPVFKSD